MVLPQTTVFCCQSFSSSADGTLDHKILARRALPDDGLGVGLTATRRIALRMRTHLMLDQFLLCFELPSTITTLIAIPVDNQATVDVLSHILRLKS